MRILILMVLTVLLCRCGENAPKKLRIATAANMQFAMKELVESFTKETGIACEMIVSSSGKLTAQIREGAPFDVLVSADMKYPDILFENGFGHAPPKVYAHGKLVMWSLLKNINLSLDFLASAQVRHIAVANPQTAPYGAAAVDFLKSKNQYNALEDKLVFGESISQTNQFVISQAAEVGFTAKSVVLSPGLQAKGIWKELPPDDYAVIEQGLIMLKNDRKLLPEAQQFFNYLFSAKARTILIKFGYAIPD